MKKGYYHYLRGSFYIGFIYLSLDKFTDHYELLSQEALFFFLLLLYIVIDFFSRSVSNEKISSEYRKAKKKYPVWLDFMVGFWELVGLIALLNFTIEFFKTMTFDSPSLSLPFGIFCICCFIHNTFYIMLDNTVEVKEYIRDVFTKDFSEYDDKSNRWGGIFVSSKTSIILKMVELLENLANRFRHFKPFESKLPILRFNCTLGVFLISISTIGIIHLIVQILGFHLIYLNLLAGIKSSLAWDYSQYISQQSLQLVIGTMCLLFLVSYMVVSREEMKRRFLSTKLTNIEKNWQIVGNLLTFTTVMMLILLLPQNLFIASFLVLQMLMGSSFIIAKWFPLTGEVVEQ